MFCDFAYHDDRRGVNAGCSCSLDNKAAKRTQNRFFIGAFGEALGAMISSFGLYQGSFGVFLFGSLRTGIYMSEQGFYRFAAIDNTSDDFRP